VLFPALPRHFSTRQHGEDCREVTAFGLRADISSPILVDFVTDTSSLTDSQLSNSLKSFPINNRAVSPAKHPVWHDACFA
jgi:hypothetical protein